MAKKYNLIQWGPITNTLGVGGAFPIDGRTVVENLVDLTNTEVWKSPGSGNETRYVGMLVYVLEDKTLYQLNEINGEEYRWASIANETSSTNIKIDGHVGTITTGNGLTDVTADGGSFAVKAKENGYISVTADGVDIDSTKIDTAGTSETDTDIVTVKRVKTIESTIGNLKDVAKSGLATDVTVGTITGATYDTETPQVSDTWRTKVSDNALLATDNVNASLSKLDNKIAGLADELILDEEAIANNITAIKSSIGLEDDLTLDITGANYITGNDTTVKGALTSLDTNLKSIEDKVDGIEVNDAKLQINGTDVFSANASSDVNITLGSGLTFSSNTLSIDAKTAVSSTNKIVTESDIAAISGAMHYCGVIDLDTIYGSVEEDSEIIFENLDPSVSKIESKKPGDTYIATGTNPVIFTRNGEKFTIEPGDMVVFGADESYSVVQSNMTLGVAEGQIATNSTTLGANKLVYSDGTGINTGDLSVSSAATISSNTITVTDTYKIGSIELTTNSFQVEAGDGIKLETTSDSKTFKVSHADTQLKATTTSNGAVDFTEENNIFTASFTTESVATDKFGHINGSNKKTNTITLPYFVNAIIGEESDDQRDELNNTDFVNVRADKDTTDTNKYLIKSSVKTVRLNDASSESINEPTWKLVSMNIDDIEAGDIVEISEIYKDDGETRYGYTEFEPLTFDDTENERGGDFAIPSGTSKVNDALIGDLEYGRKYTILDLKETGDESTLIEDTKITVGSRQVKVFRIIERRNANDGLVTANDVKSYINNQISNAELVWLIEL